MADQADTKTPEQIAAAEAAAAAAAKKDDAAKVDKKGAKPQPPAAENGAAVAVNKITYGKATVALAGTIIPAGVLTDTERADLFALGALREPTEAELAVAVAQAVAADPLG